MKRSGIADLPLHGGRVPTWLAARMTRVGHTEKLDGFRRLDRFVRTVGTRLKPQANLDELIQHEHTISPSLRGRTVFDKQRSLF